MKLRELLEENTIGRYYDITFENSGLYSIIGGVKSIRDPRIIPYLDRVIVEEFGRNVIRLEGSDSVED